MKEKIFLSFMIVMILSTNIYGADQRAQWDEYAVGANHPTQADTINRLTLIEHENDGTHDWDTMYLDDGEALVDTNGDELIRFSVDPSSSATRITIKNNTSGNPPVIQATGETNTSLQIKPSGTGIVEIIDSNDNEIIKTNYVANAVNEITIKNNTTGLDAEIQATGETDTGINLVSKGTGTIKIDNADIAVGIRARSAGFISYVDDANLHIDGNILNVKDKVAFWIVQLDYNVDTDLGAAPTASTWYYLYLDYDDITKGTAITVSQVDASTTAPTLEVEQYSSWYNGDDRCIGCFYSDSSSDIKEFTWHSDGYYEWETYKKEYDDSDVGDTFYNSLTSVYWPELGVLKVFLRVYGRHPGATAGVHIRRASTDDYLRSTNEEETLTNYMIVSTDSSQGLEAKVDHIAHTFLYIYNAGFWIHF